MRNNHFLLQQKKAETNARKRMQDFGRHAQGIENLIKLLEKMHQAKVRGSKKFGRSVPSALKRRSGFGALRNRGKRGAKREDQAAGFAAHRNRGKRGAKSSGETGKGGEEDSCKELVEGSAFCTRLESRARQNHIKSFGFDAKMQ